MEYPISKLPLEDFKRLGMDKDAVMSLPQSTLKALLSGNRTSLIRFEKVPIRGMGAFSMDAKLSLQVNKVGKLKLFVHPVQTQLKNSFDLTDTELKHLQTSESGFVPKLVSLKDGSLTEALITYDKSTNELVAIKRDNLKAPDQINGTTLSDEQKRSFISGKPVEIKNDQFQLNPNNEQGISGKSLKNFKLGHSKYRSQHMLIDLGLLACGLGHFVLLYHLANVLLHSNIVFYDPEKSLQNQQFRNALAAAKSDMFAQGLIERVPLESKTSTDLQESNENREQVINTIKHHAGKHVSKINFPNSHDPSQSDIRNSDLSKSRNNGSGLGL